MKTTMLAIVGLTVAAGSATADPTRVWDWNIGDPVNGGINHAAGQFESIYATYDADTDRFSWEITFANQITEGFTLAVSPGLDPKGHSGELALIYFDAQDHNDVRMNVFNYNGVNSASSYYDGSNASGIQTPDLIMSTLQAESAAFSYTAMDVNGKRILGLDIDASIIQGHTPAYPGNTPWTGVAFGEQMGLWLHPFANLNTTYSDGVLDSWSGNGGWFDGSGHLTVPAPGSIALAAGGALLISRRRRV